MLRVMQPRMSYGLLVFFAMLDNAFPAKYGEVINRAVLGV